MIYTKDNNNYKEFYWENRSYLGYAYQEVDGYYVFVFQEGTGGCWSEHSLREIADKLAELNQEWDKQINNYFKENNVI